MSLGDKTVSLLAFFLGVAVLMPVATFAFSFPTLGDPSYGTLDPDALASAGITLTDIVSENISRDGTAVYFTLNQSNYRVYWNTAGGAYPYGSFEFNVQVWIFWVQIEPTPYNASWVYASANWSTSYNWTRFTIDDGGANEADGFFTIHPDYGTITSCIQDGNVTLSIGRGFESNPTDFWGFATWYLGVVTGVNTGGLPIIFVWILQLILLVGTISAILLLREFIPFLP